MKHMRHNNKGTTMVETLAAFTVLAVILASLYEIVNFSSRLRIMATDTALLNQMFLREVYKKDDKVDLSLAEITYFRPVGGSTDVLAGFTLVPDEKAENYDSLEDAEKEKLSIGLNNIGAVNYKCVDDAVWDKENNKPVGTLAVPAVIHFRYVAPEPEP